MSEVTELLSRTHALRKDFHRQRIEANRAAAASIMQLDYSLSQALGTDVLAGLPNLMPEATATKFRGYRVNGSGERGLAEPIPRDGNAVLVLFNTGQLVTARRFIHAKGHPDVYVERPGPSVLQADVLEPYVRAVQAALQSHLLRMSSRIRSYERAAMLSERIASAVGLLFK